jgi:predicted permease
MSWASRAKQAWRRLRHPSRWEAELDEEVQSYFDVVTERLISRGKTPEEARRAARLEFEDAARVKEKVREARTGACIDTTLQDIRYALRLLRKSPSFAAVAVLSLALGIGASTAVFSLMDVLLIRPLPVPHADRLALISLDRTGYHFSYPLYQQIHERNSVFSATFAWWPATVQVPEGANMLLIPAVYGSGEYFQALAVAASAGRVFGPADDRPNGGADGPVAVIGYRLWERQYARDPAAVGRTLVINGVAVTIIGVMPPGFFGAEVGTAPDVWLPLNLARQLGDNVTCFNTPSCSFLHVMGRLRPDISAAQAEADLRVISMPSMEATLRAGMRSDRRAAYLARTIRSERGRSGYASLRSSVKDPLQVLMALVALVLLIACANIANLLSARASARSREVAVRLAIGAARGRVIRQFLTESLVLAAAGALGGLLFSFWATRFLAGILSTADSPVRLDLNPDWRVWLWTTAAAFGSGVLFGIGPSLRVSRQGLTATLKERARHVRAGEGSFGFGKTLLGIQVALSVVLLAAAGLFAGTLIRLLTLNPGFDPDGLTVISVVNSRPPVQGLAGIRLFARLAERARAIPGVESATLLSTTPLSNGGWSDFFVIPGRPDLSEDQRLADINAIGAQFTKTMGVPLLAGRDFNDGDTGQSEKVVLISKNAGRRWFPNGDAVGAQISMGIKPGDTRRVVGIVGDSKYLNLREEMPLTVYVPSTQSNQAGNIAIRTKMPVAATYAAFRRILREEAPGMPVRTVKTMRQQVDESLSTERLTAYLSLFIGTLALLLTAVGLYGILAYTVSRRTGEIGIRMALGAQRLSVIWLVVREAMGHTAAGMVVGVGAVLATSRVVRSLLFDVQPNDPATLAAAVGILVLVCFVAASLPARRASKLAPMEALREE